MEKEKLKLSVEEARWILSSDNNNYKIVQDNIISQGRWSIYHTIIIQRVSDNKYFSGNYTEGSTEMQDERPWEYSKPEFEEVFPKEKITIVYE
jgi:hypothetical protein